MKKFLVLTLVLGIASLASAGLSSSVSGTSVAVGDSLTIDLVSSGVTTVTSMQVQWTITSGTGTAKLVSTSATLGDPGFQAPAKWNSSTDAVHEYAGANLFGSSAITDPYTFVSGLELEGLTAGTVTLTAEVSADITLGGASISSGTELLSQQVTVIPEPATMALLGLGALVMRRKK